MSGRRWVWLALAAFLALLPGVGSYAQDLGSGSGSDLLDLFRNMSSSQQQQILRQLGGGQLGGGGGFGNLGQQRFGEEEPQNENRRPRENEEATQPRMPLFKGEDYVIVEVDTKPLPPRPTDTAELYQMLAANPGQQGMIGGLSPAQLQSQAQLQQLLQQQTAQQQQIQQLQQQTPTAEPTVTPEEQARLSQLVDLIRSRNPYQLTRDGVLDLPGFAPIPLAGLTEAQATLRLEVDPALQGLHFRLTRLPLKKTGVEGLQPFGYDLFARAPSTFAPLTDIPVPSDYIVGPGDELDVQLYGNQNRELVLFVQRDGRVNFPQLGPINVGGQRFTDVKRNLEDRVARQLIGVRASVSMGETRAIRVFILGDAYEPGSYTISGLGTITSALYAAGGLKKIGSLRDVQLKRNGAVVRHLDLYDLLIHGDNANDAKLLPGDVVFIPPIGRTAAIDGEVQRPAIYELKTESTVGDLVRLAGGLTPNAESTGWLTRIDERQRRVVLKVDLTTRAGQSMPLQNGDYLRVPRLRPTLDSAVMLQGHVFTPGAMAYRAGMRLTDVIPSVEQLKPNADLHYVLIRRELPPDRRIAVFSADLGKALASPDSPSNITLMPRDRILVFDLQSGRDRIIQPLLEELRLQSSLDRPAGVVSVQGQVKVPGQYPLEPGMRVSDLIRAGGGLTDAAYGGTAELTRYTVVHGDTRQTKLISIDLSALMRGDRVADLELQPFDTLSIKEVSQWSEQEQITLEGEVRFPGVYTIRQGETLKMVLLRAGGLTKYAFPQGSVFTREELRRREQEQLDTLAQRTQTDLATMALQAVAGSAISANGGGANAGASAIAVGQGLINQLKATKAVGRLVIDLPRIMRQPVHSPYDVVLRNGDRLAVPKFQQEVTVIGEVQSTTSHLYRPGLSRDGYIELSGGMTRQADARHIYVVRANGSVVANAGHFWFRSPNIDIRAGDTIVVPLNTEKLPPLPEWQAVTAILYNLAVASAAIHTFGVL
ncbi:MAG: SLBB domain-containing protein [Steroidobacteraceae bacterium]